ncbi:hypothetical protein GUQ70_004197 [Salmonella enterica subsp. enterica]|nr:hypothetical protein [Salmonella enterica subsp. enterica serovar Sandiego]
MENTDKKYLHEIYRSIKKNSLSLFKNIDKAIVFIIFVCTFTGSWFIYSFVRTHGVKFIDLIQTNLLISFGALSFITIFAIILIFMISFFISPIIVRNLYFNFILKEKIKKNKNRKILYFTYYASCGVIAFVFFYNFTCGLLLLFILVACYHFIIIQNPFCYKKLFKTIKLFISTALLIIIPCLILLFLSITLNFNIEGSLTFNSILQAAFILFTIIILAGTGFADRHQRIRDTKNRIQYYLIFSVAICLYMFTAFSAGISEKIVDLIGLGYQYRCYYDTDLNQYLIPDEFIQDKFNNKTKLFVVADIDGKMYIAPKNKRTTSFYFTAKELAQVSCNK